MRLSEREFAQLQRGKTVKPKEPTEIDIQNAIREYLRWHGWFVIRHHQSLGSYKGLSDLTALKDGWTVYVEVKKPTGKLSDDQEGFRDDVTAAGGTYVAARSVDDVKFLCEGNVEALRVQLKGKAVGC